MSKRSFKTKDLYIANFLREDEDDYGNSIKVYDKPIFLGKQNIQPLSGTSDIAEYGTRVRQMQKVLLDYNKYLNKFKENDVAYLEVITPEYEKVYGEKANYRIDSVRNQNKKIVIYFEKLP